MHRSIWHLCRVLVCSVFFAQCGVAQETDPFFPKDYAKDPGGRPLTPSQARTPVARNPTPAATPAARQSAAPTQVAPAVTAQPLGGGVKVTRIGAVLSGLDMVHLNESILELQKVVDEHNFEVGTIYAVGVPLEGAADERFGQQLLRLSARGGMFEVVNEPPEGIDVKRSPTWILKTEKGDVLLEGFAKLHEFISADGTFLEPITSQTELAPLASQTVVPTSSVPREQAELEARRRIEELTSQLPRQP